MADQIAVLSFAARSHAQTNGLDKAEIGRWSPGIRDCESCSHFDGPIESCQGSNFCEDNIASVHEKLRVGLASQDIAGCKVTARAIRTRQI
jgi:hypothetical protein